MHGLLIPLKLCYIIVVIISTLASKSVRVDIYYEALCTDSIMFIKSQLWPVFKTLYPTGIVTLNLYAYGNTEETLQNGLYKFTCQHGALECTLDTIETCVDNIYKKPEKIIPYVYCVADENTVSAAEKCSVGYGMDWKKIDKCRNGIMGNRLHHDVGVKTPKHTYIPWIVINGDSSNQEYLRNNLKEEVCSKYKGKKPSACKKVKKRMYPSLLVNDGEQEFWK